MRLARLPGVALFANEFISLAIDYPRNVLWLRRSDRPFRTVEDVEDCTLRLERGFPSRKRAKVAIISDFRAAPVRVTPALDPAYARYRNETERAFQACVVVVATSLGQVRAQRFVRGTAKEVALVNSIDDALAFVDDVRRRADSA